MTAGSTARNATALTTTAAAIRKVMRELNLDVVTSHFSRPDVAHDEGESDEDVDVDNEVEPFVLCDGVSVSAFNEYVRRGKDLRFGVRFLHLANDGRLLLIDLPSAVHEATVDQFLLAFFYASGNRREIKSVGSMTAHRGGEPDKEADATFGPLDDTPNRTAPPVGRAFDDWITVAVEVGRWQTWRNLEEAALWWHGYAGIKYVLLIKISLRARVLGYRLYDVEANPLGPRGVLPAPVLSGRIEREQNAPPENITFDARQVLSIPAGQPLPAGVNDPITVDLRDVMTQVIRSLGRR